MRATGADGAEPIESQCGDTTQCAEWRTDGQRDFDDLVRVERAIVSHDHAPFGTLPGATIEFRSNARPAEFLDGIRSSPDGVHGATVVGPGPTSKAHRHICGQRDMMRLARISTAMPQFTWSNASSLVHGEVPRGC